VDVEVLRVVDVAVWTIDNTIDHSRLKIQHNRARDVARVVGLVEEDILAIAAGVRALGGVWVKVAILVNTVLETELLPEL
jgi:DNA-binding IclR family transcriptional regulator